MCRYRLVIILLWVVSSGNLMGQEDTFNEKRFFQNLQDSYYTLAGTSKENLTALVTSAKMEVFADSAWANREVFPLQFIWVNPGKLYLSEKGVPTMEDAYAEQYGMLVSALKQQMKGILIDLQRFYINGLYRTIPDNYQLTHDERFVKVDYSTDIGGQTTNVYHTFGHNGLCLRIDIQYPQQNKSLTILPEFRTIKTKWLCEGWMVQTKIGDEVESGFQLTIEWMQSDEIWVPQDIVLSVQKKSKMGRTFFDQIKLRNYLFNQSLQLQIKN
ncbi:MAG: hypothetical protein GF313_06755 [Caldithrix sp.]|nr:hypothetical protein [Caldithrix sp.]